jgi:hypothetical protein
MKKAIKKKKSAKKMLNPKKKSAKRKAAPKKASMKTRAVSNKGISGGRATLLLEEVRQKSRGLDTVVFAPEELGRGRRSGELSGDLQGLSNIEDADSESVAELVEEGNAFEADVVKGVEDAASPDTGPARTREVPEDDVPDVQTQRVMSERSMALLENCCIRRLTD